MFSLSVQSIISNQMRPRRLRGAWHSRLLRHPARRRSGSTLSPGTTRGEIEFTLGMGKLEWLGYNRMMIDSVAWAQTSTSQTNRQPRRHSNSRRNTQSRAAKTSISAVTLSTVK